MFLTFNFFFYYFIIDLVTILVISIIIWEKIIKENENKKLKYKKGKKYKVLIFFQTKA